MIKLFPIKIVSKLSKSKPNSYDLGRYSENLACNYLKKRQWKILAQNYKTKLGEVDIIAFYPKMQTIVGFEIKYRTDKEILPYTIAITQQKRVRNSFEYFLIENPQYYNYNQSLDAIFVDKHGNIEHIENAF